MEKKVRDLILYSTLIIAGIVLLVYGLIQAQKFLIPVVFAILLAMLVLPVERKLLQWKFPRVLAVLLSDLLIILLITAVFFVVGLQVKSIIAEWPKYEKKLMPKIEKLQQFIEDKTGIAPREQIDKAKSTIGGANGANGSGAMSSVSGVFSSFGNFFLIFVYMFFFMGIIKAVFDSVPLLNPLGYVLNEKDTEPDAGPITTVKKKVEKKVKK